LVSVAEILSIRPSLKAIALKAIARASAMGAWPGGACDAMLILQKYGELSMRALRLAVAIMFLASPAIAQTPKLNLLADKPGKTQDEIDAEKAQDKAYKESLKKIPDGKQPTDPWGSVRSDAPAAAPAAKSASSSRPKKSGTATSGSTAN
jgi:hypothetical protein